MKKGDIVRVKQIEHNRRRGLEKFVGKEYKIKEISSPVWKYNIYLEPIQQQEGLEALMEKFFLERNTWNECELELQS